MPGHMGSVQVTIQNLEVVRVDADKNLILVKGAIPGPKKGPCDSQRDHKSLISALDEKGGPFRWQTYLFIICKDRKSARST